MIFKVGACAGWGKGGFAIGAKRWAKMSQKLVGGKENTAPPATSKRTSL